MINEETLKDKIIKRQGLWEFIKFTSVSLLTSALEIGVFSLLNYVIFIHLSNVDFVFGPFDYSVVNGGLCAFLAFSISYIVAQIFNFIVQRKITFKANNQVISSAVMYVFMIIGIFILQMWLPTLIHVPIAHLVGHDAADFIIKNMMMFLAFLIQFPMNKWIIMKKIE